MTAFFQAVGKYEILKQLLRILVSDSRTLFGRNFRAVLVMRSSPGAFFLRRSRMMPCTVPGVVKMSDLMVERLFRWSKLADTSGMSGPGFVWNWSSRESATSSARSVASKTRPFGPTRGWDAGRL